MNQFRVTGLLIHLWALIAVQVVTGICILVGLRLGQPPQSAFIGLFLGLNVPTLLLSAGTGYAARGISFRFLAVMALIMLNFIRAGMMSGGIDDLCGLLHILTAQSLWLAYPAYRASRV
jgi:hypothetical protein